MSIDTTKTVDVSLDTTDLTFENTKDITVPGSTEVDIQESRSTVEGFKKEYSIVGDGLYASVSVDEAPEWLSGLIDSVVNASIANGMTDYDLLVQDVRNAIDSINIAKNTYVEQININPLIDGIVVSKLETLNATYEENFATKADLSTAIATSEASIAQDITDLSVGFGEDLTSRITAVQTAYADADSALAADIAQLESSFEDQESNLAAVANAASGLQTYVGLTESNVPNGTGLLSSVTLLQKQADGLIETFVGMHELVNNDMDGNINTNELRVDQWPYALWLPMEGTTNPTFTTRTAYKDGVAAQYPVPEHTVYKNIANNTFWEYHPTTYGGWEPILETEYLLRKTTVRDSHLGDSYIRYQIVNGASSYEESYKFVKLDIDTTSPFNTDSEGYSWAVVSDTPADAAYLEALNAYALADGKISQFYAWGGTNAPADYTITNPDDSTETIDGDSFVYWYYSNGVLHHKPNSTWVPVPGGYGEGVHIAEGDLLTVFNPDTRDYTNYTYNGTSWAQVGPTGIVSKSKFFVDLENEVTGSEGHVAKSLSQLSIDSNAYADEVSASVENKFAYDSSISLDGQLYKSGFGLNTSGVTQPSGANGTAGNEFDSEFWINAERLVLKSPSYPSVSASFTVTDSGLYLATEYTEATRNEPRGGYNSSTNYVRGDVVTFNNSSYTALKSLKNVTPSNDGVNWQLLAAQGTSPLLYDWTGNVSWPTSTTAANALTHTFQSTFGGNAVVKLKLYDAEGGVRATLNGGGETAFTRTLGDNTEEWYEVAFNTLQAGTNTLRIWSSNGDGGSVKAIQVGLVGVNGDIYREVFLYQNSASAPTVPAVTNGWSSSTGNAAATGSWTTGASTPSVGQLTWRTQITLKQPQGLGAWTHVDNAWGTVVQLTGLSGEATDTIYTVSSVAPATPSSSSSIPSGWSATLPTKVDNIWVSIGTKGQGSTTYTWGAPVMLSEHTSNLLLAQKTLPWPTGTGNASTEGGTWSSNGDASEQNRVVKTDPFGGESVVWEGINAGTDNGADGGFVSPAVTTAGTDKLYRFSVFMRQESTNGSKYFGLYSDSAIKTGSTTTANPYFFSGNLPSSNEWYLLVGYLKPYGSSSYTVADSGIYRVSDGVRISSVSNFIINNSGDTTLRLRCYQYYNTSSANNTVDFWGPRIDLMDDRAPTVTDLLRKSVQGETFKEIFLYANGVTAPTLPSITGSFNSSTGAAEDEDGWTTSPTASSVLGVSTWRTSLTLKRVSDISPWVAHDSSWNTAVKVTGNDGSANKHIGLTINSYMALDSTENKVSKVSGGSSWNGELKSTTSYTGGAYVTVVPNQNTKNFMIGFTTDPNTNTSYNSIDYAWYIRSDGDAYIYENGTNIGNLGGAYSAGDDFTITYDNISVRYYKNGVLKRTIADAGADKKLYLDSSFYHEGDDLTRAISFGPMGARGIEGQQGVAGAGFYGSEYPSISTTDSTITSRFTTITGRAPVLGDVFTQTTSEGNSNSKRYDGTKWVAPNLVVTGDMVVTGGITADNIAITNLASIGNANMGTITAGKLSSSDGKFVVDLDSKTISIET